VDYSPPKEVGPKGLSGFKIQTLMGIWPINWGKFLAQSPPKKVRVKKIGKGLEKVLPKVNFLPLEFVIL